MIIGRISGDGPVLLKLRSMNIRIRDALRAAVKREAIGLTRYVKRNKLSGQVLKNRSDHLRASINFRVDESNTSIIGHVGTNVRYGRAHEYGFDGVVTVREHLRHAKGGDMRARLDGKRQLVAQGIGVVRAHERHMHLPQRSFLRSSLREVEPGIRQRLRAAVAGAIQ